MEIPVDILIYFYFYFILLRAILNTIVYDQQVNMSYSEHFSIKNIPYGIATEPGHSQKGVVTRIHDNVVFLNDLDIQVSEEVKKALGQVRSISHSPMGL